MDEKLQKVLARVGLGSRRMLEEWIRAGRVSVNGVVAQIGDRVRMDVRITVDGRPVSSQRFNPRRRIVIYHKPVGEVCTRHDPEGRATIFAALPRLRDGRWITVGRLDLTTSGLLLITNDGELANVLMHPSHKVEREYAVRVRGEASDETLLALRKGVALDDGLAHFDSILDGGGVGSNHWYHVSLREGRNREVRRLWEARGIEVSRLIRVRYATVALPRRLRAGHWEELGAEETEALLHCVGMTPEKEVAAQGMRGRKAHVTRSGQRGHSKAAGAASRSRAPALADKPISKRYPRMVERDELRPGRCPAGRHNTGTKTGNGSAKPVTRTAPRKASSRGDGVRGKGAQGHTQKGRSGRNSSPRK